MNITEKQLDDFIQYLQGTCMSMDEARVKFFKDEDVDENEDFTADQLDTICGEIGHCETCGWWVEVCEIDEEGNCQDCSDE